MSLDEYMKSLTADERQLFADRVERSYHYLRHVAKGRKLAGPKLALAIERESDGAVKREDLRSDYFGSAA